MKSIPLLLFGLLSLFSDGVSSTPADLTLQQLNHREFTAADGAPSTITALAQTSDGTFWIGSPAGLTRFDGVRFVSYPGRSEEPLLANNISSLLATPDGGLWIGFRPGGVSLLKGGRVESYGESDGLPDGTIGQFALDRDGSVWAAARTGLTRLKNKRWEKVVDLPQLDTPYGVLVDSGGTLWVATVEGLLARFAGENHFRVVDSRHYSDPAGLLLTASPDGRIWAASTHGLLSIDTAANPRLTSIAAVRNIIGGPLLFDTHGNLWASDADGLLRVRAQKLTRESRVAIVQPEMFTRAEGWTAGRVFAFLEDRERNIWVGNNTGLHRFSHGNVVRDAVPPCAPDVFNTAAFTAGDAGTLWMACTDSTATQVREIRDGAIVRRLITPGFNVAYRDPMGIVWFGGPTALAHFENGQMVTGELPSQVRGRPVQALVRDSTGAMWVSLSRRGVFRVRDGEWTAYGNLDALPRRYALVLTADRNGTLWFGYSNNRIAQVSDGRVQLFDSKHGLELGNVLSILAHDGEVWVGGDLGFARFDGTRFVPMRSTSEAPFKGVSGIVRARNGDFWLNGVGGIVRIARQEIERVIRDPAYRVNSESFNYLDGVPGTAVQLRPQPSAIETTDGRIWFATTLGVVSIDATRLVRNMLPPLVTIWSLTSGDNRYANLGAHVQLPVDTTNLEIEYSASSFTVPERVHFRYKLEGSDREWQDVGTRREALYTNLGPGHYTFRVSASNNDGIWNETSTAMRFTIPPALYQTGWFYAFCGLVCVSILFALYRVRIRQVAAQVRGRLEARLAERERIARELHDTLLQGIQGLIWKFQAATDRIPPEEPAKKLMEQSLDRADQLLGESRDRVKDLRPTTGDVADLAQALVTEGEEFAQLFPAAFRVSVEGTCRDLHPIVREEGLLIGREALSNAFRHARARNIEAEVAYGETTLHVRIRDDGQGINTAVLEAGGKPGHFGLVGMRERAKKLGAHVEVWSKPGAGTEVELRVPAAVAYKHAQEDSRYTQWWHSLFRISSQNN